MTIIALSPMTILGGCGPSPTSPARITVQIPRDCEELAKPVPYPETTRNAKIDLARERAAHGEANTNLVATRTCQEQQRERFAEGN